MNRKLEIQDPRKLDDFQPLLMPLCDGEQAPPPDTLETFQRRMIEFASLYYRMNMAQARADAARERGDKAAERVELEILRAAGRLREALEDQYHPEGFLAEPVMAGTRYMDLVFSWAGKPAKRHPYRQRFKSEITF